jgi:hypothetical protein
MWGLHKFIIVEQTFIPHENYSCHPILLAPFRGLRPI